jgi:Ice-binding-like
MSPSFLSSLTIVAVILAAFAQGNVDIPLGACSSFAVEAGTAITFAGTVTTIASGNIGVSPGTSIGGNVVLATGSFERQSTLSIACARDLDIAYLAASEALPTTILSAVPNSKGLPTADLSGLTLGPGVYSSVGSIIVSATTVTLDGGGDSNAQFVFQAATNVVTSTSTSFILVNGAQASNVYWVVGTQVTLGNASSFVGTILAGTAVVFNTNSVLQGRALAHTAVTFAGLGTVTLPVSSVLMSALSVPSVNQIKSSISSSNNLRSRIAIKSSPQPINLGDCADFAVLAGSSASFDGVLNVIASGDVGVSPGTSITGSYQVKDGSVEINSSSANQCAADRITAYNAASAAVCPPSQIVNELSGLTLAPGVYCTSGGRMSVSAGIVTLDAGGDSNAVWIFQTPSELSTAPNTQFLLLNGAKATNVFWKVGSSATLGYSSTFVGTILAYASISVDKNIVISGRALAGAGVSLAGNDVITVPSAL